MRVFIVSWAALLVTILLVFILRRLERGFLIGSEGLGIGDTVDTLGDIFLDARGDFFVALAREERDAS